MVKDDAHLGFASGVLQMGHFPLFRFSSIPGMRTMHLLFLHLKNEPVANVSSSFLLVVKSCLLREIEIRKMIPSPSVKCKHGVD